MPEDTAVDTAVAWPSPQEAGLRVREMQTKLHRWAAADRGRRFDDVYNFVSDPATLAVALQRVAGNAGARTAGVDGVTAVWAFAIVAQGAACVPAALSLPLGAT
jgi:RNA-directed DNA polymerase